MAPPPPGLSTLCQAICQELRKTAISDLLLHLLDVISNPETLDASLFWLVDDDTGLRVAITRLTDAADIDDPLQSVMEFDHLVGVVADDITQQEGHGNMGVADEADGRLQQLKR